jgi:uncharacterized membrane protein
LRKNVVIAGAIILVAGIVIFVASGFFLVSSASTELNAVGTLSATATLSPGQTISVGNVSGNEFAILGYQDSSGSPLQISASGAIYQKTGAAHRNGVETFVVVVGGASGETAVSITNNQSSTEILHYGLSTLSNLSSLAAGALGALAGIAVFIIGLVVLIVGFVLKPKAGQIQAAIGAS